jgi:hypothetical protein
LVRRIGDDQPQVKYSVVGRSGGRVTLCAIRIIHVEETKSAGFWFSLKTGGDGLLVVWPQNHCDSFLLWASKSRSMIWRFGSQNHRDGFLVWTSKLSERRFIGLFLKPDRRMKTV